MGQGDSTLIVLPEGGVILFDGGGASKSIAPSKSIFVYLMFYLGVVEYMCDSINPVVIIFCFTFMFCIYIYLFC